MKAVLYGIGVGPGDPELMTIKAVRLIKESDIIVVPGKEAKLSAAYTIAKGAYPDIDKKSILAIDMPMTKDKEQLQESHKRGVEILVNLLSQEKQVAFLTLGDPSVYSTYMYLHYGVENAGYPAKIISGVTSFCAAAAALDMSLVEKSQMLHVIPATYGIKESLNYPGTKVFMKAGKKINELKQELQHLKKEVKMVENCGMQNEKVYHSIEDIPEDAGYYSLLIVKEAE